MERTLEPGPVISRVFAIYREHAAVLLGTALAVFVIEAILAVALGSVGSAFILVFVVGLILSTLYQGMVVELVDDVRDGRLDHTVGGLVRSVTPVLAPLVAVGLLAAIGVAIGFVLLIVPGLILLTLWSVVAPVVVLERTGVLDAFRRSHALVRGNAVKVFQVIVLFFLIGIVVVLALSAVGAAAGDAGAAIAQLLAQVLTAPLTALAAAVLYFELRGEPTRPGEPVAASAPATPGLTSDPFNRG